MPTRQAIFAHELTANLHESLQANSPICIVANGWRHNITIENMVLDESPGDFVFSIKFRATEGIGKDAGVDGLEDICIDLEIESELTGEVYKTCVKPKEEDRAELEDANMTTKEDVLIEVEYSDRAEAAEFLASVCESLAMESLFIAGIDGLIPQANYRVISFAAKTQKHGVVVSVALEEVSPEPTRIKVDLDARELEDAIARLVNLVTRNDN